MAGCYNCIHRKTDEFPFYTVCRLDNSVRMPSWKCPNYKYGKESNEKVVMWNEH